MALQVTVNKDVPTTIAGVHSGKKYKNTGTKIIPPPAPMMVPNIATAIPNNIKPKILMISIP